MKLEILCRFYPHPTPTGLVNLASPTKKDLLTIISDDFAVISKC